MRKITLILIVIITTFITKKSVSMEFGGWDVHLKGVSEGMTSGVIPEPGLYLYTNTYFSSQAQYKGDVHYNHVLDLIIEQPLFLWSTGLKLLGADYAVGLVQPFNHSVFNSYGITAYQGGDVSNQTASTAHFGHYNTGIIPAELSWAITNDIHVKTGLLVWLNNASSTVLVSENFVGSSVQSQLKGNRGFPSGTGYYSIVPNLAASWTRNSWTFNIDAHLGFNMRNNQTGYTSGDELTIDYSIMKKLNDKWQAGLGFYSGHQLTNDTQAAGKFPLNLGVAQASRKASSEAAYFGIGPVITYQFPGVSMTAEYNHSLYEKNTFTGNIYNVRMGIPLY
jgi:hypothetical protein